MSAATLDSLVDNFINIANLVVPILLGIALLYFFWGLVKFLSSSKMDDSKIEEAKQMMIWGIASLFIMASAWGIANVIASSFNLGDTKVDNSVIDLLFP